MAAIDPATKNEPPPARPEYADPVDPVQTEPVDRVGGELDEPTATLPPIVDPDGEIEELEDRSMPIERLLFAVTDEGKRVERTYVQKGLSWFGKIELYGILGQAVKVVLEGDNPLGISTMVDMARDPRQMITDMMGSLPGADTMPGKAEEQDVDVEAAKVLAACAQVVSMAPQLLEQAYCIALAVPKLHRNWAIEWAFPNMSDEMGSDILHAFIDQNLGVMEDFFFAELPKIIKRTVKARSKERSDGRR